MPFTSSSSLVTLQVRCVAASSKTRPVTAGARVIPSIRSGFFCTPRARRLTPRQQERLREAFTADEAHISVEVAYHCAGKCARSSTKPHPPKADAWPHTSSSTYQPAPSPKSPAWAGPYANGRTHSTPTSTPAEPATGQQKPSTDIIELGRRTARGYRNPTNYQPRMPLTTAGLGTSPHPTMQSRNRTRRVVGVGPRSCGVDR